MPFMDLETPASRRHGGENSRVDGLDAKGQGQIFKRQELGSGITGSKSSLHDGNDDSLFHSDWLGAVCGPSEGAVAPFTIPAKIHSGDQPCTPVVNLLVGLRHGIVPWPILTDRRFRQYNQFRALLRLYFLLLSPALCSHPDASAPQLHG